LGEWTVLFGLKADLLHEKCDRFHGSLALFNESVIGII